MKNKSELEQGAVNSESEFKSDFNWGVDHSEIDTPKNTNPISLRIKNNSSSPKVVAIFSLSDLDPEVEIKSTYSGGHSYERLLNTCLTRPHGINMIRIHAENNAFVKRPMTFYRLESNQGAARSVSFLPIMHFSRWQYHGGIVDLPFKMRVDGSDELHIVLAAGEEVTMNFFMGMSARLLSDQTLSILEEYDFCKNKFREGEYFTVHNKTDQPKSVSLFHLLKKHVDHQNDYCESILNRCFSADWYHELAIPEDGVEIFNHNRTDAYSSIEKNTDNKYMKRATELIESGYSFEKLCVICDNKEQFHNPIVLSPDQSILSPYAYIDGFQQWKMAHIHLETPRKIDGAPMTMTIEPNTSVDIILYSGNDDWESYTNSENPDAKKIQSSTASKKYTYNQTTPIGVYNAGNKVLSEDILTHLPSRVFKANVIRIYFNDLHELKRPFAYQFTSNDGYVTTHNVFPIMWFDLFGNDLLGFVDVSIPEFNYMEASKRKILFDIEPSKRLNVDLLFDENRNDPENALVGYRPTWAVVVENTFDHKQEVDLFDVSKIKMERFGIPEGVNVSTQTSYFSNTYAEIMAQCHAHEEIGIGGIRMMSNSDFKSGFPELKFTRLPDGAVADEQGNLPWNIVPFFGLMFSPYQQTSKIIDIKCHDAVGSRKKMIFSLPPKTTAWFFIQLNPYTESKQNN